MNRIWENPIQLRRQAQGGPIRKMVIGAYAPHEPAVMTSVLGFLQHEKKYPIKTVHRIIDRLASMTVSTTVVTHTEVVEFITSLPDDFAIAKGPCACRLHTAEDSRPDAMDIAAGELSFCRQSPLDVDIQIAACGEKFAALESYERISKDQLLALEKECHNMGLVPNIYVLLGGEAGICHCSRATCAPFMANEAIGGRSAVVLRGRFVAKTDKKRCNGTGNCTRVCHFQARSLAGDSKGQVVQFRADKCYGCGLCAEVCPESAISLAVR